MYEASLIPWRSRNVPFKDQWRFEVALQIGIRRRSWFLSVPPSAAHPSPPTTAATLLNKVRLRRRGTVLPVSTTHHLTIALLLLRWVAACHARRRLLDHRVALAVGVLLVLKVLRARRGSAVAGSRAVVEACRPRNLLVLLGEQGLLVLELLLADG